MSYELVLQYAHLAPEKLSIVAGRFERQAFKHIDERYGGENVAKNARLGATVVHLCWVSS